MSVRNNEKTLSSALRSIVNQTWTSWELILVDDGSSDQTVPLARRFAAADGRIRLLADGAQKGLPDRLNQSIDASRGRYYARMDGDDVAYPERLRRQVEYLEAHSTVDLVGAWAIVFGADGRAFGKRTGAEHHEAICARPHAGFLLGYREERIDLKKTLTSRYYLVKSLWHELCCQGRPLLASRAVVEQVLKGTFDVAAVKTGLNYRLMRHRARPATALELQTWSQVWAALQGA
jgi:glycosyltransferase involved in cell wall biosynthesis